MSQTSLGGKPDVNSSLMLMLIQQQQAMNQQQQQLNTLMNEVAELKTQLAVKTSEGAGRSRCWTEREIQKMTSELNVAPIKKNIMQRVGQGNNWFDYISITQVIDNMNKVFGIDGWSDEYRDVDLKQIYGPSNDPSGKGHYFMSCMATCVITLKDGATRVDVGEGDGIMSNLHECVCKAKKQAFSDALKRAARKFGKFVGNGLSDRDGGKKNAPGTEEERQQERL